MLISCRAGCVCVPVKPNLPVAQNFGESGHPEHDGRPSMGVILSKHRVQRGFLSHPGCSSHSQVPAWAPDLQPEPSRGWTDMEIGGGRALR